MARTNKYGTRGGTSRTAGRKAETVHFPLGLTKRVFFGQRWGVISQPDENSKLHIYMHATEAEAEACYRRIHLVPNAPGRDDLVCYVAEGTVRGAASV